MNSKIIKTALKIVPNFLQQKAIAAAFNLVFVHKAKLPSGSKRIQVTISEFDKSWFITLNNAVFSPLKASHDSKIDIRLEADIATLLRAQDKRGLTEALKSGKLKVIADQENTQPFIEAIHSIQQPHIDHLITQGYAFLRMNPYGHIHFNTVTINDIKKPLDIDYIRDQALKLESNDLPMALKLMTLAHQARPEGPFIKQKLHDYQLRLNTGD
jgi:hypothetical protein